MYNRFIPLTNQKRDFFISKKYFTHKVLCTEIVESKKYRSKLFNRYKSEEKSYVTTFCGDKPGDFLYNALILFAIQKIANTEEYPVFVTGKTKNGKEIVMPENIIEYKEKIQDVNYLKITFLVGENKLHYTMTVDNFLNIITITTSAYHPEELGTFNILKLLCGKINEIIRYVEISEQLQLSLTKCS